MIRKIIDFFFKKEEIQAVQGSNSRYTPSFSEKLFRYLQSERIYKVKVSVLVRRPFENGDELTITARSKWQAIKIARKFIQDKIIIIKADKVINQGKKSKFNPNA